METITKPQEEPPFSPQQLDALAKIHGRGRQRRGSRGGKSISANENRRSGSTDDEAHSPFRRPRSSSGHSVPQSPMSPWSPWSVNSPWSAGTPRSAQSSHAPCSPSTPGSARTPSSAKDNYNEFIMSPSSSGTINTQLSAPKVPKQVVVEAKIVDKMDGGDVINGEWVSLVRDGNNKYDKNAIRVDNTGGEKIGYIDESQSAVLSPLLDSDRIRVHARVYTGSHQRTTPVMIFICGDTEDVDRVNLPMLRSEAEIDYSSRSDKSPDSSESEVKGIVQRVQNEMSTCLRSFDDLRVLCKRLERFELSSKLSQEQQVLPQTLDSQTHAKQVQTVILTQSATVDCPTTASITTSTNSGAPITLASGLDTNSEETLELVNSDIILVDTPMTGEAVTCDTINIQDLMKQYGIVTSEVRF